MKIRLHARYIILISYAHLIEIASQLINGLQGGVEGMCVSIKGSVVYYTTLSSESFQNLQSI